MAVVCRTRLLQLPCRAYQCPDTGRIPPSRHRLVATHAAAAESKGSVHMGTDDAAGERLASKTDHPQSLAERPLCRHTPKVGAVCGKAARTVLCGGRGMKHASLPLQRRAFISLLGGAAAWPLVAGAQQTIPLVGVISLLSPQTALKPITAFRDGLREAGYFEGQNV